MTIHLIKPKAILFDWDNTLVCTWPTIYKAINATLGEFGLPLYTFEEVKLKAHQSAREAFPRLFGERWEKARDFFYQNISLYHLEELQAMPGALALLGFLTDKKIQSGVVSNKKSSMLVKEIDFLNWSRFFSVVVGSGDTELDKPAPDPILLALEKLGLTASPDIWFVGDTIADWQAAEASGCQPIALGEGCAQGLDFPVVSDCHHLLEILSDLL